MKTAFDPRHQKRRETVKILFAESFAIQPNTPELVTKIMAKTTSIDERIKKAAPTFPVENLNRIDLAILRLAVYELDEGITPPKVVIDEAIELAKEFGSDNSASFINGALGTIYKDK